ncbi:hypothetical protein LTR37_006243 [Vermiconidia calcicola]|uniref:Uncharacterized protein n=1 Tax=Vermiconidia calcicola TaxID=1690605 RepID=A0ACC3NH29_9PEZI|nr:hypothetical protein LTR37_006243 [Vermiconidia calcicola]
MEQREEARQLIAQWDAPLIAASIAISLLGAFTSTQLMCQARTSRHFAGVLVWTMLGSLTFGFCSIWALHEVAMLAYGLDLRIGIDVGLTVLSAVLAVCFTFVALASDLLYDRYTKARRKGRSKSRRKSRTPEARLADEESSEPLLQQAKGCQRTGSIDLERARALSLSESQQQQRPSLAIIQDSTPKTVHSNGVNGFAERPTKTDLAQPLLAQSVNQTVFAETPTEHMMQRADSQNDESSEREGSEHGVDTASYHSPSSYVASSRRSSSFGTSAASALGLGGIMSIKSHWKNPDTLGNPFVATYRALRAGLKLRNVTKAFFWAIAITSMHYVGVRALRIPHGHVELNPFLVLLSGVICWIVCLVGCILILEIEVHLGQQLLFSAVATSGVAAMHFTGMRAATFYSFEPPSDVRGYPPGLATAIAAVAISTCIAANLLLAHSATVSRNKLAEIVWTRRKLWMAIAQKESAETAAAARSDFIASASHEIRTPLHHLQGYSDLLSRTELTDEGRLLLYAIQRATKTLSLITNNVLDWSRLERDGETTCRPVALDLRTICESIITLLPNQDEDVDVELYVVVAPNLPTSLFIDETYIHRILMNLLSNALKFTSSGYILLSIEMEGQKLVASVTDTGCGIPTSFLPQLFEPFKQAQTRGRARGTGLGLSIIKQLLHNMAGAIEVESKFQDDEDVGPGRSGSTFTVTIPVQQSTPSPHHPLDTTMAGKHKIAIVHAGTIRALDGLKAAWERFGFEVMVIQDLSDLAPDPVDYIWVDLPSLKTRPPLLRQLAKRTDSVVLVPYDMRSSLYELPGFAQAPRHIIPVQKPLIWHVIQKRIVNAGLHHGSRSTNLPRTVRFDPVVTDLEEFQDKEQSPIENPNRRQQSFAEEPSIVETVVKDASPKKGLVVLLVEDNPINCKLGKKMLESLGYQVRIAEDGVAALEQIVIHDADVDAILMDQSMPRMDGLTATKEIRAMEASGALKRKRPIIAVSAVVSVEATSLFRAAGADDFLAKPLSLGRLEGSLATHLHLHESS